jgi:hypothetical protein
LNYQKELSFDEYTSDMVKFLENYRATEKEKKHAKAKAQAANKKPSASDAQEDADEEDHESMDDDDDEETENIIKTNEDDSGDEAEPDVEPAAKRVKMDEMVMPSEEPISPLKGDLREFDNMPAVPENSSNAEQATMKVAPDAQTLNSEE